MQEGVFDDHHRAIHHQADGDGQTTERHQVGRNAQLVHGHEGEQRREHQRADHDQRRAHVTKEEEEHDDDQQNAFEQHLGHRPQRGIDQFRTVVIRLDLQAIGQHALAIDFLDPCLDAADHFLGVAAGDHHHHTTDRLGHAVLDHRSLANFVTDLHFGHVADVNRHTVLFLEHDGAQVLDIAHQTDTANQVLLGILRQHAATGVGVVATDRLIDIGHRQAKVAQLVRIDQNLILPGETALRIDLGHARNRAQQRTHHPVLGDPALHQLLFAQRFVTVVGTLQRVLIDLAQAGGNRTEYRRNAFRQARADFEQALHDQLAGEIDVGLVIEDQGDQRQAGLVQRSHFLQTGQAGHRHFQRHGGKTLDFLRRTARGFGGNLHLNVGDVREGIDRQLLRRIQAKEKEDRGNDRDDQALLERRTDEGLDHDPSISLRLRSLFRWKAPSTTSFSPPFRPLCKARTPPCSGPSLTLSRRKTPSPSATKT